MPTIIEVLEEHAQYPISRSDLLVRLVEALHDYYTLRELETHLEHHIEEEFLRSATFAAYGANDDVLYCWLSSTKFKLENWL